MIGRNPVRGMLAISVLGATLTAQTTTPERQVRANVITSERNPKIQIQLPRTVQYVGADRWVLYGIADCELHAFVEADRQKHVQQLYWIQFEGYLPSKPELHHKYDSPRHTTIGGLDFYVDTWVKSAAADIKPGSDLEHIETLIRNQGYKLPDGIMAVRLVHLLDEQKRKELMIIYAEDVTPTGFTAVQMGPHGNASNRWPTIEQGLIARAEQQIELKETAEH
jgi:hypothetical protein